MEKPKKSLLSKPAILHHLEIGNIIIDPFERRCLGTNSYDVRLGEHYWVERYPANDEGSPRLDLPQVKGNRTIYYPYDKQHVESLWEQRTAKYVEEYPELLGHIKRKAIRNLKPTDKIILIDPQEAILGHTIEFIGGASNNITTMCKARSSTGRNFLEVARCAGLGDIGYHNRWTLEITNNSRFHTIPLLVGMRIAQIVFFETDPATDNRYTQNGKYQRSSNLQNLRANWGPEDMLPKMYLDWETEKETYK